MPEPAHLADKPADPPGPARLPRRIKWLYGSGDWSLASFNTLRQIFYAIFLTDVVGLDARLASLAALVGILWDALNDPIIGTASDRLHTRLGRRRPFLLIFGVPFGLSFLLQWWVPPWSSQIALMISVGLAFMVCDTLQTLIAVPYASLTPELTSDYDERTSLTGHRMFFNLCASLVTAVAAPILIDAGGADQQRGYLLMATIFGGLAMLPPLLIGLLIRERPLAAPDEREAGAPLLATLGLIWRNVPFRFATLLYLFNWVTFDLVALMLPFFLVYWVAGGDVRAAVSLGGEPLALESAVLGAMLVTSVVALPLWIWLANRLSKQRAYVAAMALWAAVQVALYLVQPGQVGLVIGLAVLAGIAVAAAHVLPDAIFPDVIDWDEVRTHRRREGTYYGIKNFARKLTGAIAIFVALQTLGWSGYQAPADGAGRVTQSQATLTVIRLLMGPLPALLIGAAAITTLAYPLTRERHRRIQRVLERRAARRARG